MCEVRDSSAGKRAITRSSSSRRRFSASTGRVLRVDLLDARTRLPAKVNSCRHTADFFSLPVWGSVYVGL
jgi:hypothetical protein